MRKLATNLLIVMFFVLGVAVVSAYADEKKAGDTWHHHRPGYERVCKGRDFHFFLFKKLGLNDQQKEAIRAIRFRTMKEAVKTKADIKLAKMELREILSKEPVNISAAEAAVKKIEGLRADLKIMHIKAVQEIKSNLNDEQKKQFKAIMMHKMMERKWERCGCHERHRGAWMKEKGKA